MQTEQEEILEMPSNIVALDDMAIRLWQKYFTPKETLNPTQRRSLMNQYNLVAKRRNELSDFKALMYITPSTRIEFKPGHGIIPPGIGVPSKVPASAILTPVNAPKITGGNIIQQIIAHYLAGKTNKEIISLGFNKSTVARQVGEYKKRQNLN